MAVAPMTSGMVWSDTVRVFLYGELWDVLTGWLS